MHLSTLGYAVAAICLVTLIPAVIFIALLNDKMSSDKLLLFVSTAIGALLGNVIYHLIPEALGAEHPNLGVLTMLLVGILAFLFGEQTLQQYHSGHGHSHFDVMEEERDFEEMTSYDHHQLPQHFGPLLVSSDLIHSFVDGMAIGTSFVNSYIMGISTTIAVFFHEVPHILGDYAVLTSTGFSKLQLCYYSGAVVFSSVCGASLVIGLESLISASNNTAFQQTLLAFASGNFLYISLSDLIPEVLIKRVPSSPKGYLHYLFLLAGASSMLVLRVVTH